MADTFRRRPAAIAAGIIAVLAGGLFLSCSEDATEANAIVSPVALRNFVFRETVVYPDTVAQFTRHLPMDGPVNLVGQADGCTAKMLLQFTPAYLPLSDTVSVLSDTLWLRNVSWFGDSAAKCSFNVYRINLTWDPTTVTWDSIGSGFADGPGLERGSATVTPSSDSQWVGIPLDTAMVRIWLSSDTSYDAMKYGIMLVPSTSSGNVILGFSQFTTDTTLTPRISVVTRGQSAGDTSTYATYSSGIGTFIANLDNAAPDKTKLFVQAGIVRRAFLHFNVSGIPTGAFVSKANLLLNEVPGASILNRWSGSQAVVAHLLTSTTDTTVIDRSRFTTGSIKSGDTMAVDVRFIVQSWITGTNDGMVVSTTSSSDYLSTRDSEHSSLDLYVFAGNTSATPLSRRPRIHIVYALGK